MTKIEFIVAFVDAHREAFILTFLLMGLVVAVVLVHYTSPRETLCPRCGSEMQNHGWSGCDMCCRRCGYGGAPEKLDLGSAKEGTQYAVQLLAGTWYDVSVHQTPKDAREALKEMRERGHREDMSRIVERTETILSLENSHEGS